MLILNSDWVVKQLYRSQYCYCSYESDNNTWTRTLSVVARCIVSPAQLRDALGRVLRQETCEGLKIITHRRFKHYPWAPGKPHLCVIMLKEWCSTNSWVWNIRPTRRKLELTARLTNTQSHASGIKTYMNSVRCMHI